jgi:nucleotide-binding universal stress UspA family protein
MFTPKLIMAPLDFSGFSMEALETAKDLAAHYNAELLLLHVVPFIPMLPDGVDYFQDGKYEEQLSNSAEATLAKLADQLRASGIKARTAVGTANDAAMEIVRTAEDEKVDLIVIPTHGMTGWKRLAFGSVTDKVVRTANCPVLVLRSNVAEESKGAAGKSKGAHAAD